MQTRFLSGLLIPLSLALSACGAPRRSAPLATAPAKSAPVPAPIDDVEVRIRAAHEANIVEAHFSASERLLATIGDDWKVAIWSLDPPRWVSGFVAPGPVEQLVFSADDARVGLVTRHGAAIYDVATGDTSRRFFGSERTVAVRGTMRFTADLKELITLLDASGHLEISDLTKEVPARAIETRVTDARLADLSDAGRVALLLDRGDHVHVFDLEAGARSTRETFTPVTPRFAWAAPDGQSAIVIERGFTKLIDLKAGKTALATRAEGALYRGDGRYAALLTRLYDGSGRVAFEIYSAAPFKKLAHGDFKLDLGERLGNGREVTDLVRWGDDGQLIVWDGELGLVAFDPRTGARSPRGAAALPLGAFSSHARKLVRFSERDLEVREAVTGVLLLRSIDQAPSPWIDLAWSPDGAALAAARRAPMGTSYSTWRADGGLPKPSLVAPASGLHWSLDGARLVHVDGANERGVDAQTGRELPWARGLLWLGPRADLELALTGQKGKPAIELRASGSRKVLREGNIPWQHAWSADGKRVAVAFALKQLSIFDTSNGALIADLDTDRPTSTVALSPDGARVAVSCLQATGLGTDLWDVAARTKKEISGQGFHTLAFSADGGALLMMPTSGAVVQLRDGLSGRDLGDVALPHKLTNPAPFVARDLAALLTRDRSVDEVRALVAKIPSGERVSAALRSDGRFLALGAEVLRVVRLSDGVTLELLGDDKGAPVRVAIDEDGSFDGPEDGLAMVLVEHSGPPQTVLAALLDPLRKKGIFNDFLRGPTGSGSSPSAPAR